MHPSEGLCVSVADHSGGQALTDRRRISWRRVHRGAPHRERGCPMPPASRAGGHIAGTAPRFGSQPRLWRSLLAALKTPLDRPLRPRSGSALRSARQALSGGGRAGPPRGRRPSPPGRASGVEAAGPPCSRHRRKRPSRAVSRIAKGNALGPGSQAWRIGRVGVAHATGICALVHNLGSGARIGRAESPITGAPRAPGAGVGGRSTSDP